MAAEWFDNKVDSRQKIEDTHAAKDSSWDRFSKNTAFGSWDIPFAKRSYQVPKHEKKTDALVLYFCSVKKNILGFI